jgi:hypothetical protein
MGLPHAWKTNDFVFVRDRFGLVIQLTHADADKLRHAISLMIDRDDADEAPSNRRRVLDTDVARW